MSSILSVVIALFLTSIIGDCIVTIVVAAAVFILKRFIVRAINQCVAGISTSSAIVCATAATASFLVAIATRLIVSIVLSCDDLIFVLVHSFVNCQLVS